MEMTVPRKTRYHRIDGWRGYTMPRLAVAGASDTGTWSDSPCRSGDVMAEIIRFQEEVLKPMKIKSTVVQGDSSNVFCTKHWITVSQKDFVRAAAATLKWLKEHKYDTEYIHDADLETLIVEKEAANG
jgi:hypothetical protein